MTLRLYNTLSRQEEPFTPSLDNTVRMYACGPTVYARAHIGNFRTFVCVDVLRRALMHIGGHAMRQAINYTDVDFSKWAIERYGKPQRRTYDGGVDVVINFTGGDTWVPSLRCVKRGGKILVCGATAGYDPKEDLRYIWSFEIEVKGSNSFYDDDLAGLMTLIQQGKMKPVIDKVLPLEQAAEGLRLIQDRKVIGKVVVKP